MSDVATNPAIGERASARGSALAHANTDARAESRAPAHLGAVDWLRLLAIAAVAYYHTHTIWYPESVVGPYAFAGLHALTAASVFFAALLRSAASDRDIVVKRFHRLLVPWLAFSLFFMALAIRSGHFRLSMIWTGGSTHLWFLPFIFIVGCAVAMARRRSAIVRNGAQAMLWSMLAIVAMLIEPRIGRHLPTVEPVWQVVNALPSVFVGLAIFALPAGTTIALLQLAAFATAGVAAQLLAPDDSPAWPAAAACGGIVFGLCRLLPVPANPASAFFARTSFGVYLAHLVALTIVIRVLARLLPGNLNAQGAVASDPFGLIIAAQVALAIVICIAGVAVVERTPFRRFVG